MIPKLQESRHLVSLGPQLCWPWAGAQQVTEAPLPLPTALHRTPLLLSPHFFLLPHPCSWATGLLTSLFPRARSHSQPGQEFLHLLVLKEIRGHSPPPPRLPLLVQLSLASEKFSQLLSPSPYSLVSFAVKHLPLLLLLH